MPGLNVGEATTWLRGYLGTALDPVLVGDGVAPEDGGWAEGTPNSASGFAEYVVLKGERTSNMQARTALCRTFSDSFHMAYRLSSFHTSRSAADDLLADAVEVMRTLGDAGTVAVGPQMEVYGHQLWLDSVGGAVRDDSTYPKLWSSQASFRLGMAWSAA